MDALDSFKEEWSRDASRGNQSFLNKEEVSTLVATRVKREHKIITKYILGSGVWQLMIYAALSHFAIRFWGQWNLVLLCIAGILIYIPFTIVFLNKFKALCGAYDKSRSMATDISTHVQKQYSLLKSFYNFKRKFEWLSVPLTSFLSMVIIFNLYRITPISQHWIGALITCLIIALPFVIALYVENRKQFEQPLEQLEKIIDDLEEKVAGGN